MEIKLLKDLDKHALVQGASAYAAAFNEAGVGENWEQEPTEKYFEYCLQRQNDLFFVAIFEDKVVGGIMGEIRRLSTEFLFITDLFVNPQFQGKGIAKQLFVKLLKTVKNNYPESKTVDTLADSTKPFPIGWYDKLGMHTTGWTHISGTIQEALTKLTS